MNKTVLGLVTTAIASVAGGVAFSSISSDYLSAANAESGVNTPIEESVEKPTNEEGSESSNEVIKSSEVTEEPTKNQFSTIAKTYTHEISGREAITVYVRNIPVATFLGNDPSKRSENSESVAPTKATESPIPSISEKSSQFVDTLNQLSKPDFDANKIGVKWQKDEKQYLIHIEQSPLLAMNDNVTLPRTTKDQGEDALQITNRLRRQIGNVKPLKEIEGRPTPPARVAVAPTNARRYQDGWASWYGPGFHGNLTASGTRYNQYGLTAAHRTLPFGTKLRVTNRNNGRSVIVTITDRGPFIYDRVIDLSMGAAQAIGVTGVSPVSLDIVN